MMLERAPRKPTANHQRLFTCLGRLVVELSCQWLKDTNFSKKWLNLANSDRRKDEGCLEPVQGLIFINYIFKKQSKNVFKCCISRTSSSSHPSFWVSSKPSWVCCSSTNCLIELLHGWSHGMRKMSPVLNVKKLFSVGNLDGKISPKIWSLK